MAPATINQNMPSYHAYQVLGVVPVHVVVVRNCNNTAVCVKSTPHRTYACNMPSRSKGVYCVVHAYCVRNGHRSSKSSRQWFTCLAQVPTTVIIHVELCILVENITQNREM